MTDMTKNTATDVDALIRSAVSRGLSLKEFVEENLDPSGHLTEHLKNLRIDDFLSKIDTAIVEIREAATIYSEISIAETPNTSNYLLEKYRGRVVEEATLLAETRLSYTSLKAKLSALEQDGVVRREGGGKWQFFSGN